MDFGKHNLRSEVSFSATGKGCVLVLLDGWMVVRFVGVPRVPLCARVSCVRPVCVPAPPVSFYRYR
jgi:hypothetical protein